MQSCWAYLAGQDNVYSVPPLSSNVLNGTSEAAGLNVRVGYCVHVRIDHSVPT